LPLKKNRTMNIDQFITAVEEEFDDEIASGSITPEVKFRELFDWNSINALRLIALVKTEYDLSINAEDIQQSETVNDLYQIIQQRMG